MEVVWIKVGPNQFVRKEIPVEEGQDSPRVEENSVEEPRNDSESIEGGSDSPPPGSSDQDRPEELHPEPPRQEFGEESDGVEEDDNDQPTEADSHAGPDPEEESGSSFEEVDDTEATREEWIENEEEWSEGSGSVDEEGLAGWGQEGAARAETWVEEPPATREDLEWEDASSRGPRSGEEEREERSRDDRSREEQAEEVYDDDEDGEYDEEGYEDDPRTGGRPGPWSD